MATEDMFYDDQVVHDSLTDKRLVDIMLAIVNNDKPALAEKVAYPLSRYYPLRIIEDSAQMVRYFDVIFDDSIKNVIRESTISSWESCNYHGEALRDEEYIWYNGKINGISYYSKRELDMLNALRQQEMASLDVSLQGNWYPLNCLRDVNDGTVFRVDGRDSVYEDNYDKEIRMAIYDEGKNLYGKPSRVLMGIYHQEGSWPSRYLYCSSYFDMVWLSFSFDSYEMEYYERGDMVKREIDSCYWLDLLK